MSHARFQKQQREKARQEKAAAKRDRRAARLDATAAEEPEEREPTSESRVLAELDELHKEFDDGALDFEEFEQRKSSLLSQLEV